MQINAVFEIPSLCLFTTPNIMGHWIVYSIIVTSHHHFVSSPTAVESSSGSFHIRNMWCIVWMFFKSSAHSMWTSLLLSFIKETDIFQCSPVVNISDWWFNQEFYTNPSSRRAPAVDYITPSVGKKEWDFYSLNQGRPNKAATTWVHTVRVSTESPVSFVHWQI